MKVVLSLVLLAAAGSVSASCIIQAPEEKIAESDTVFIATIVSASLADPSRKLEPGTFYKVIFTFDVRRRIKGDPSKVPSLYSTFLYNDPLTPGQFSRESESTLIVPGDSVVVFAKGDGPAWAGSCEVPMQDMVKYLDARKP